MTLFPRLFDPAMDPGSAVLPESPVKTLRYRPAFPERVSSIEDARGPIVFHWYNADHHRTGPGLLTRNDMRDTRAEQPTKELSDTGGALTPRLVSRLLAFFFHRRRMRPLVIC